MLHEAEKLYSETILDHYEAPRNFGKPAHADASWEESNPLCGDVIAFHLTIKDGKIDSIRFSGKGCAISTASASMLTEMLKGGKVSDIKSLERDAITRMLGIAVTPVRLKCALLPMYAAKKALVMYEQKHKRKKEENVQTRRGRKTIETSNKRKRRTMEKGNEENGE